MSYDDWRCNGYDTEEPYEKEACAYCGAVGRGKDICDQCRFNQDRICDCKAEAADHRNLARLAMVDAGKDTGYMRIYHECRARMFFAIADGLDAQAAHYEQQWIHDSAAINVGGRAA